MYKIDILKITKYEFIITVRKNIKTESLYNYQ